MSLQLSMLLTSLFPAVLLAVLGYVIRTYGPRGFVHGIVDWIQVDEPTRKRAGHLVGNTLFAMAALIAGHSVLRYFDFGNTAIHNLVNIIFIGGICLLVIVMIFGLLQLQGKNRKHGR
jgi:ABC-type multidrug transport system permease subunit